MVIAAADQLHIFRPLACFSLGFFHVGGPFGFACKRRGNRLFHFNDRRFFADNHIFLKLCHLKRGFLEDLYGCRHRADFVAPVSVRDVFKLFENVAAFTDSVGQVAHGRFDAVDRLAYRDAKPIGYHQADSEKDSDADQVGFFSNRDTRGRILTGNISLLVRMIDQRFNFLTYVRIDFQKVFRQPNDLRSLLPFNQTHAHTPPGI